MVNYLNFENLLIQRLEYGGLSIPRPDLQEKASHVFWLRRMLMEGDHSWKRMLDHWLVEAYRPSIDLHFKLGRQDWKKTGARLQNISSFWSALFRDMAKLLKLQEEMEPEFWAHLPVVGSLEEGNNVDNILFNQNTEQWITSGFATISQACLTDQLGRIIPNRIKSREELQQEFGIVVSVMNMNKIARLVQLTRQRNRLFWDNILPTQSTTLISLLQKNKRGSAFATNLLLKNIRRSWVNVAPRAFQTYRQDRLTGDLTAEQFVKELGRLRKNCLPPAVQWTSCQIFLRTLWTRKKEANAARNNNNLFDSNCSNCGNHEEDTVGLVFHCVKARQVREIVQDCINDALTHLNCQNIELTRNSILFHQVENTTKEIRAEIVPMLMILKHTLYKMKFREDQRNFPSERRILVNLVIDLERHLEVSKFCKKKNNNSRNRCYALEGFCWFLSWTGSVGCSVTGNQGGGAP